MGSVLETPICHKKKKKQPVEGVTKKRGHVRILEIDRKCRQVIGLPLQGSTGTALRPSSFWFPHCSDEEGMGMDASRNPCPWPVCVYMRAKKNESCDIFCSLQRSPRFRIQEIERLPQHDLAHITPGRKRDPFYMNIRNPIPPKK